MASSGEVTSRMLRPSDDTEVDWSEVASGDPTEARNEATFQVVVAGVVTKIVKALSS